jgi:hypothetical protein
MSTSIYFFVAVLDVEHSLSILATSRAYSPVGFVVEGSWNLDRRPAPNAKSICHVALLSKERLYTVYTYQLF